ncbi:hypothetical protein BU23DRAFT_582911 [Bimuria novae-zelandiae CBS 107.79]|uniref:Fungal lipase-like domain-containing protein n=1 Tax=Bimuria novae-zelandiae CBS 107.79 TaxID=1447943 RepID=A0A6A5UUW6_9PLEO|nr:hypothetical protein BU23DRAFT_582911 [Bimuria novae-zelandiae CBS 107.79]
MPLVELQNGPSQWGDIKDAADILLKASVYPNVNMLGAELQRHYNNYGLFALNLRPGVNTNRRAVLVCNGEKITIAFEGSTPDEAHQDNWVNAKGPGWWELDHPIYDRENRVHSFYHQNWRRMQWSTCDALNRAVDFICHRGDQPKQIVIVGYSQGGGVSTFADIDIVEHIRNTWGTQSIGPQEWTKEESLGSLVQHLTVAAIGAADQGYYTTLNDFYGQYQIRAWDFMSTSDTSLHTHFNEFRAWRGYHYILPRVIAGQFDNDFGAQGHGILGYFRVAEWMAENKSDQVRSEYNY